MLLSEFLKEVYWKLFAALASAQPNLIKVAFVAEVLGDSDRQVEVLHSMPPVARHKDSFTRVLHTFDDDRQAISAIWPFCFFQPRQNFIEILNRLIIFALLKKMLSAHQWLRDSWTWWHHDPSLVATDTRVPCWCAKWVLMHLTTWSLWSNQEPSVWWCFLLSELIKENKGKISRKNKIDGSEIVFES